MIDLGIALQKAEEKRSLEFVANKLDKMSKAWLINVDRSTKHALMQARDIVLEKIKEG